MKHQENPTRQFYEHCYSHLKIYGSTDFANIPDKSDIITYNCAAVSYQQSMTWFDGWINPLRRRAFFQRRLKIVLTEELPF